MAEYISREATVKAFCEKCKGYYDGHCVHRGECDIDVIQTAPAADVQPVRRGRWIWDSNAPYREHGAYKCSNCDGHSDFEENYCPNCGARLDSDAE